MLIVIALGERDMPPALVYQVFLTRNSEYHVQGYVCVGVRDRRTGQWFLEHPALSRPLAGAVLSTGQVAPLHVPNLGESLEFFLDRLDGEPLRTSPVLNIEERDLRAGERTIRRTPLRPVAQRRAEDPRVTR
jgi:hypothetical protein